MFMDGNFQVLCLQETHFIRDGKYSFNLPGYSLYNAYAPQGDRRGGVSLYISNSLLHMELQIQSTLQVVACSVRLQNKRITFCSLYLPPADDFSFQGLSQMIQQLLKPFIICADANSKHYMWGASQCDRRECLWMDIVNHHDLHILNDGQPTRLDELTGDTSHIDLTLVSSDLSHMVEWDTDKYLHSIDHFPIHIQVCTPTPPTNLPPIFLGWNVRKANWTEFEMACNFKFNPDIGVENCQEITRAIVEKAHTFIPIRNGNSKYQCPWWNDECREAIKTKRRAQNRMRRDPHSQFLRIEYRKARLEKLTFAGILAYQEILYSEIVTRKK